MRIRNQTNPDAAKIIVRCELYFTFMKIRTISDALQMARKSAIERAIAAESIFILYATIVRIIRHVSAKKLLM